MTNLKRSSTQNSASPVKPKKMNYMPGLDGLRAIAVLGILIYHLNKQWLSGGFLGVDTFFVISGYLITSLLLIEHHQTGTISLKRFWYRRVKRLIPAMLFVVSVTTIFTLLFQRDEILRVKQDAIAAIFYVSNWWYIAKDVNYFDQFSFEPLKHLWSLAIEEQFYLFFPLVLILLLAKVKKHKQIVLIFWIISLASLLAMVLITHPGMNFSRVYFGTDTRLQTLLLGVILAFLWPPNRLRKDPPLAVRMSVDLMGVISLAILMTLFVVVEDQSYWIYNGGFYLISGITLFLIASVVHPSGLLARFMGNPLFVYIGQRSYSLYLWHFPIIVLLHRYFVAGQIPVWVYVVDVVLTFIMAEVSYRYVETPFRKQGFKMLSFRTKSKRIWVHWLALLVIAIPFAVILAGVFDHYGKDKTADKATQFNTNAIDKYVVRPVPYGKIDFLGNGGGKQPEEQVEVYNKVKPLLIGDSVMVDIGERFKEQVPHSVIDGKVGRNMYQAKPLIEQNYSHYNKKGDQVIIELGTNGDFNKEQLDDVIASFGKADIYLVNTRVPRSYEGHVNQLMKEAAKEHKNVKLVDWYKRSAGHPEYFAYDGIHLEYPGVKALSDEIIKTMGLSKKDK
ncbi:acyltransferase family protein [Staphylococcus simulans]|uniref:acyltransferase family protein n=1 Tax=Staphylococcus simulans TaxID=1286 RepID=UPI000D1F80C1|nr:acyltransferase family protein [Staphylococcus simulans]PTJ20381.1 acyltransferase [Staphylococcus simulans]